MSYIAQALAPGETVRASARLHWVLWLRAWAALIVLGIVIVGIVIFARQVIFNLTTEIAATDRRLIRKLGFLERRVMDIGLENIESVNIDQDFWGTVFGYGRLSIHGTGDQSFVTPLIADPVTFRREIEAAMPQRQKKD
ncbi:MAG: PH domain-containing protein [Alphaproteobacteria bacterium]|nr:PH domain-containing protein [Alphaproteobacteria bacterium]